MKKNAVIFLFSLILFFLVESKVYPGYVEIDVNRKNIKIKDISFGENGISGNFNYQIDKEDGRIIFLIKRKNLKLGGKELKNVQVNLEKKGNILFFNEIKSSRFSGTGTVDLKEEKILFNFSGTWQENLEYFKGDINLQAKIWGDFDSFLISGNFIVTDGVYEGISFKKLRCSFVGTPPVFNVTDAKVILHEGSIFELKGNLDIRDSENFFPGAEFLSEKLFVDGWQIFGEEEEVGLKKQIDDKFNVEIDTEREAESGTELRYSLENDNFLKLRMQEEETILGLEKKKEF